MVQATVNEGMQYGIGILLVLILVVGIGIYLTPALEYDTPDFPTAAEIADLVDLSVPVNTTVSIDNVKINAIYDEIFKDDNIKDIAEQLALDELETKSFKKDLVNFLLSNNITNVTLKDIDYKDVKNLKHFIDGFKRIKNRYYSGVCLQHQKKLSNAIKRARHVALLPFTN